MHELQAPWSASRPSPSWAAAWVCQQGQHNTARQLPLHTQLNKLLLAPRAAASEPQCTLPPPMGPHCSPRAPHAALPLQANIGLGHVWAVLATDASYDNIIASGQVVQVHEEEEGGP